MDSLTQVILGASVGEVVLGRKIGNRAMLWGGIAATIPDLDVIVGKIFMDDLHSLAFHRGISHSIFFAVFFSFILAWLVRWHYARGHHKQRWVQVMAIFLDIVLVGVFFFLLYKVLSLIAAYWVALLVGIMGFAWMLFLGWRLVTKYYFVDQPSIDIGWQSWYWLFFWAIFTHPLLDCFTTYGTQLFAPFTNYRVAFNSVAVVDLHYTIPFLICLWAASNMLRGQYDARMGVHQIDSGFGIKKSIYGLRQKVTILGLVLSTGYLLWTVYHKYQVDQVMEKTLAQMNISYKRYMTSPALFTNTLWSGTAETDSSFYSGMYSFNDKVPRFKLRKIPKNHHLLHDKPDDETIRILSWFSNHYFSVLRRNDGRLQMNDLRYGRMDDHVDNEQNYVFRFVIEKDSSGYYHLVHPPGEGRRDRDPKKAFKKLQERIAGE